MYDKNICLIFLLLIIIVVLISKLHNTNCDYTDLIEKIDKLSLTEI